MTWGAVRRHLLLVGAVLVGATSLLGASAEAVTPDDHGFWWKAQSGTGPLLPPPPGVAADGVWVANDPTGEQAVSALRVRLDEPTLPVALVLTVTEVRGTPAVRACRAEPDWVAASNGAWSARPTALCDQGEVAGSPSADGTTWSFGIGSIAVEDGFDVALLPARGAGTFSLSFAKPSDDSIATTTRAREEPVIAAEPVEPFAFDPAPSGGFAAPVSAIDATAFDVDPSAQIAPLAARPASTGGREFVQPASVRLPDGRRQPLALLAAAALIGAWVWRTRVALLASAGHPLAGPLSLGGDRSALQATGSLLAEEVREP